MDNIEYNFKNLFNINWNIENTEFNNDEINNILTKDEIDNRDIIVINDTVQKNKIDIPIKNLLNIIKKIKNEDVMMNLLEKYSIIYDKFTEIYNVDKNDDKYLINSFIILIYIMIKNDMKKELKKIFDKIDELKLIKTKIV